MDQLSVLEADASFQCSVAALTVDERIGDAIITPPANIMADTVAFAAYFFAFLAGIHFSFSGYFCACGKSGLSFLHNILVIVLVRIPGVYLTSRLFKTTLFPMGLATAAGSLLSVFICVIAFYVIYHKEPIRKDHHFFGYH